MGWFSLGQRLKILGYGSRSEPLENQVPTPHPRARLAERIARRSWRRRTHPLAGRRPRGAQCRRPDARSSVSGARPRPVGHGRCTSSTHRRRSWRSWSPRRPGCTTRGSGLPESPLVRDSLRAMRESQCGARASGSDWSRIAQLAFAHALESVRAVAGQHRT